MKRNKQIKSLIVYVFLTVYSIATVFPFFWMVLSSFKSSGAVFEIPPQWVPDLLFKPGMWDSYFKVLTKHNFLRYIWNSSFISVTSSLGQLLTCSLAAFAFARMQFKGKQMIFALLVATMMVPTEVTIIPEFLLFSKLGWLNTYAPLIVPSLLVGAFGTFMLKEFFESVPASLEEAAIIDGCSPLKVYWHVFMPVAKPSLATLFIIAFMNNWNEILRPVLYIQSPQLRTLTLGLSQFQSEYTTDWNLLLSASVITILPLIIVYVFNQRFVMEGMMTSGIKG
ncbi:carbohydrate ABC transporter permease [Paenibacillus fonticola]|uniref:carbohydrate ABC transporter permease n=1 Tax=Paenibacillus fonticola TaxID=379896 RepID=UPI0003625AA9|nr:carbohydrate ABC transporter permease [Paenibacillus fonticola]